MTERGWTARLFKEKLALIHSVGNSPVSCSGLGFFLYPA